MMTPQLQQAIKLLQLNHLELADALREEMEQNPTLEEHQSEANDESFDTSLKEMENAVDNPSDSTSHENSTPSGGANDQELAQDLQGVALTQDSTDDARSAQGDVAVSEPTSKEVERDVDWENYLDTYSYSLPASAGPGGDDLPAFDATLSASESLQDHLRWQVQMHGMAEAQVRIAAILIEEINDLGYLPKDAAETVSEELDVDTGEVDEVIAELQRFEPLGVAARDLRECLLIQCRNRFPGAQLSLAIIDKHLPDIEKRNFQKIAKAQAVCIEDIGKAIKVIGQLDPKPGRQFSDREPQYITPDIYVEKVGDAWAISLNEDGLPKLKVSSYYRNAIGGSGGTTKSYIQERLRSAAWLIRSIHMRQRTIYKVTESILKFQRDFFDKGVTHLKPLILKDVADDVGMHESTISRVTTNKYMHTPRGIFELKYFFNSSINRIGQEGIASESVRDHIKRLIEHEDPRKPLSDQKLVTLLKTKDIDIARRTVAKYREMLRIPPSSKRKQVF